MIDPINITNFNLSKEQLEEQLLFWILAAGKNGVTSAKCLEKFLTKCKTFTRKELTPFELIKTISKADLPNMMKNCGIGCYNNKSKSFIDLVNSNLSLTTCTVEDLEKIRGIGPKTARCFLIHTREKCELAGLDTHILKFLKDNGVSNVPKSTPVGKNYLRLEQEFLKLVKKSNMNVAEFDLMIWNKYRAGIVFSG